MKCDFCDANAQYRDRESGSALCLLHSRLRVVGPRRDPTAAPLAIRPATAADREQIEALAHYFWGETEVECFEKTYEVLDLPAHVACDGDGVVGVVSYAAEGDALNLVMLNVLPEYQGRGAGRGLLAAAEGVARARGLERVVVATTNDDLPAFTSTSGAATA